jgi:hypothetical protein
LNPYFMKYKKIKKTERIQILENLKNNQRLVCDKCGESLNKVKV